MFSAIKKFELDVSYLHPLVNMNVKFKKMLVNDTEAYIN